MGGYWKKEEIEKLGNNYSGKSLDELVVILRRTEFGIVGKLRNLAKEYPKQWDKKRISSLTIKLTKKYQANPEKYARKLSRKPEIDSLIFEQGLNMKQTGKALGISAGSVMYYINSRDLGERYNEIKENRGLPRRPEIDELIEQGLNQNQTAEKLGLCRNAIHQYIDSRDLYKEYAEKQKEIQGKKVDKIEELVKQGLNKYRIEEILHMGSKTVQGLIDSRKSLHNKYNKIQQEIKEKKITARDPMIKKLVKKGESAYEISEELDISATTVYRRLKSIPGLYDLYKENLKEEIWYVNGKRMSFKRKK